MVKEIYDTIKKVAETHKLIKTFRYDMLSNVGGNGEDTYPMIFLEMPLYLGTTSVTKGTTPFTINLDIVLTPQALENYDVKQLSNVSCQHMASQIALQIVSRLRNLYRNDESTMEVKNYSMMTLQNWYDDSAYGVRLTIDGTIYNEINYCTDDDYFDENKKIDKEHFLSKINTDDAEGCKSFEYKLPNFDL